MPRTATPGPKPLGSTIGGHSKGLRHNIPDPGLAVHVKRVRLLCVFLGGSGPTEGHQAGRCSLGGSADLHAMWIPAVCASDQTSHGPFPMQQASDGSVFVSQRHTTQPEERKKEATTWSPSWYGPSGLRWAAYRFGAGMVAGVWPSLGDDTTGSCNVSTAWPARPPLPVAGCHRLVRDDRTDDW